MKRILPSLKIALYVVAVAANLTLYVFPSSRWVAIGNLHAETLFDITAYSGRSAGHELNEEPPNRVVVRRLDRAAIGHPNDAAIQLAYALRGTGSLDEQRRPVVSAARIMGVLRQFPAAPLVMAAYTQSVASLVLAEPKLLHATPAQLAAFDRYLRRGSAADPGNAFWPAMRVVWYVARGDKTDAVRALHSASSQPRWDNYSMLQALGVLRLCEGASRTGDPSAALAAMTSNSMSYQEPLRRSAIALRQHASALEAAGRIQEGVQIRHDLMRFGAMVRSQSHGDIARLGGVTIVTIASSRLGGTPDIKRTATVLGDQLRPARRSRYIAWLRANGYAQETRWVSAEFEADDMARLRGQQSVRLMDPVRHLVPFVVAWVTSFPLFAVTAILFISWLGAPLRTRREKGISVPLVVGSLCSVLIGQPIFAVACLGALIALRSVALRAGPPPETRLVRWLPVLASVMAILYAVVVFDAGYQRQRLYSEAIADITGHSGA